MSHQSPYKTVSRTSAAEYVVEKSRFIGHCMCVVTEQQALSHIAAIRKAYSDATHNCYAYKIRGNTIARYSDDGEPGGTAGLPMMEALGTLGLQDVSVVVTRYFGGVLLGAGGLVRAYSKTAHMAIKAAQPVMMTPVQHFTLTAPYAAFDKLIAHLGASGIPYGNQAFTDKTSVEAFVPVEKAAGFQTAMMDKFGGKITIRSTTTSYKPINIE